jgi:hypothetical protein
MIGIYIFAAMVLVALVIIAAPTFYHDWKKSHKHITK